MSKKKIEIFWELNYHRILSIIIIIIVRFVLVGNYPLYLLKNYKESLTGYLTGASLVIGILGIMIPSLIEAKNNVKVIQNIFIQDKKKKIRKFLRDGFIYGLFSIGLTIYMYYPEDSNKYTINAVISYLWLYLIFAFLFSVFKVMNLVITMLLINPQDEEQK